MGRYLTTTDQNLEEHLENLEFQTATLLTWEFNIAHSDTVAFCCCCKTEKKVWKPIWNFWNFRHQPKDLGSYASVL